MQLSAVLLALLISGPALPSEFQTLNLKVKGMVCSFCAQGMVKALSHIDSVQDVAVDLDTHLVRVRAKPGKSLSADELFDRIEKAGFEVEVPQSPAGP